MGESTVRRRRRKAKALPEGHLVVRVERRRYARYVPPRCGRIVLRRTGLAGFLRGNLVLEWADVGEGGFKAVLRRAVGVGEVLQGYLLYLPYRERFAVLARVRYVRASESRPGAHMAGFAFVDPSGALLACIREALSGAPAPPRPSRLRRGLT